MTPLDLEKPYLPISADPHDRRRILILTEGAKTEINYLKNFMTLHGLPHDRILVQQPTNCSPAGLVKTAIAELAWNDWLAATGAAYVAEVWCVFDRDQHAFFKEALEISQAYPRIHLVPSSPCIELWFLHHYNVRRDEYPLLKQQIGKPETSFRRENNILYETTTVRYNVSDVAAVQCLQELRRYYPNYGKKAKDIAAHLAKHVSEAVKADYPLSQQNFDGCWTLLPVLLRRLLAVCYGAEEIERRLPSAETSPLPTATVSLREKLEPLAVRLRQMRNDGLPARKIYEQLVSEGINISLSALTRWLAANAPKRQRKEDAATKMNEA